MALMEFISMVPLFSSLSYPEKRRLAELDHTFIRYGQEEIVINQGSKSNAFFLVIKGSVRVCRNDAPNKAIALLKSGAIFGEIAYLTGQKRSTNVIAHEDDVVVMRITEETLAGLSPEVREKIKDKLIEVLARRLTQMNDAWISQFTLEY